MGEVAAPHWTAAGEGRLVVQRCGDCDALRWPPLVGCPECLSRNTAWVDVAPRGTVWSYVVYHRAFARDLAGEIPYTVAMVELDDGPYMVGRLAAEEPLAVGDRVVAVFSDGGTRSVRWRRDPTSTEKGRAWPRPSASSCPASCRPTPRPCATCPTSRGSSSGSASTTSWTASTSCSPR